MNLIFLDVDDVLNSLRSRKEQKAKLGFVHSGAYLPFDEEALKNLQTLIRTIDGYIVIHSTWRKYEDHMQVLLKKLEEYNLRNRVIGITPIIYLRNSNTKHLEIRAYLDELGYNYPFVILEDGKINDEYLKKYQIVINGKIGLTKDDVKKAISLIEIQKQNYPFQL